MSNSSLISKTILSPNHSGKRKYVISRITPHCVVGQLTASSIAGCFTSPSRKASCNYGIGKDGEVVLICDEANRSWCSSSSDNDNRAITIECASDKVNPYTFNSVVFNRLIELTVDIMKRNGKTKLVYFSDKQTALSYKPKDNELLLTWHCWFAAKSCPGQWMLDHANEYVAKVNSAFVSAPTSQAPTQAPTPQVSVSSFSVGDIVTLTSNVIQYNGGPIRRDYLLKEYQISQLKGDRAVLSIGGVVVYAVSTKFLVSKVSKVKPQPVSYLSVPFKVKVKDPISIYAYASDKLTCGTAAAGVYTIVEIDDTYGKLKSGAGWISLKNIIFI